MERLTKRQPAVPAVAGFLSGVALGLHGILASALPWPLSLGVCALCFPRENRVRKVLIALACLTLGAWAGNRARLDAETRVARWVPSDGSAVELLLEGRLLSAPERTPGNEWRLRFEGGPASTAGYRAKLLLSVRSSPPDAVGNLDAMRRGDRVRVWCRVRRLTPPPSPERPDPGRALLARGFDLVGSVKSARLVERIAPGAPTPGRLLDQVGGSLRRRLRARFAHRHETRQVVGAMLLGDRAELPPETLRVLRDAGLIHLVTISGLHVGMLVLVLAAFAKRLPGPMWLATMMTAAGVASLPSLVGPRAPVLRAAGAALVALSGRSVGRDGTPLNTLAVIAAVLAFCRPWWILAPGFQLSFLATAGILAFTGRLAAVLPLPRCAALAAAVSISAYLATAPVVAWHYGRLAPVALLSNLCATPLCAVILLSGAAAIALPDVAGLVTVATLTADLAVRALSWLAVTAAGLPGSGWVVGRPSTGSIVTIYTLLVVVARAPHAARVPGRVSVMGRILLVGNAIACGWLHVGPWPERPESEIELRAIDVGQGQALLIRDDMGGAIVVDAGPTTGGRFDTGDRIVTPVLSGIGCRRIDTLIVTHVHDDHAGGVRALLRNLDVGEVVVSRASLGTTRTRALIRDAAARGVPTVVAKRGDRMVRSTLELGVIHPGPTISGLDENNHSLVVRIGRGELRVLIPGDLEGPGEADVLRSGLAVDAQVLIAGHHGSRGATTSPFLRAVAPAIAVVSAGRRNAFGHPHAETLKRLREMDVRILRTDLEGTLTLRGASGRWQVGSP